MNYNKILYVAQQRDVFTIEDIVKDLQLDEKGKRQATSIVSKLCNKDKIHRYEKGVYGIIKTNERFGGKYFTPYSEALTKAYISDGNGYISGDDFCYRIGLTTWCAAVKTLVSNKVTRKQIKGGKVIVLPPKVKINTDNQTCLQILDCIENLEHFPIDAENPYKIIMNYIRNKNIDMTQLCAFAKRYYKKDTLNQLIKIIEVDYFETA